MMLLQILLTSVVLIILKTLSLGTLVLLCPLLVAMIMIGVILLMILKIYLSPMMNMRLIIVFAIILKVGLEECQLNLDNVQSYEVFDKSGFGEVMTLF